MKIKVCRREFQEDYTFGELFVDGKFLCYTLEDKVREEAGKPVSEWKIAAKTAIPKGKYKVVVDFSNRFQKMLPRLLNVEGFEGIRIHCGNTSKDTEGCILVGTSIDRDNFIGGSKAAFANLMFLLENEKDITIEIS